MATCKKCYHLAACDAWVRHGTTLYDDFIYSVENCPYYKPTADVAEVKHGEWVDKYNNKYYNHLYECSVCGVEALYEVYVNELGQTKLRQALSDYCPKCGAKMDGGK